jgi:prohibitin 2
MAWLIVTVILGIIGGIALTVAVMAPRDTETSGGTRLGGFVIAGLCILVWLVVTVGLSVHTVGQRQVGVVKNFSGTITGKVDPGVAWTAPWQNIARENTGIQREEFDLGQGNSAVSQDQQPVYARITLNYQVLPQDVIGLYKRVGPSWKATLLDSRVLQDFKEVTSEYTAQEITTKREDLRKKTRQRLEAELGQYDIRVVDFFVKNIDYSQAYANAIDAKNRQVQASLQAEAKVSQARAEADQKIAKARGEAEAIILKGRALAAHPEVLRLTAIEKLNPKASIVICTGNTCPAFLPSSFKAGG